MAVSLKKGQKVSLTKNNPGPVSYTHLTKRAWPGEKFQRKDYVLD